MCYCCFDMPVFIFISISLWWATQWYVSQNWPVWVVDELACWPSKGNCYWPQWPDAKPFYIWTMVGFVRFIGGKILQDLTICPWWKKWSGRITKRVESSLVSPLNVNIKRSCVQLRRPTPSSWVYKSVKRELLLTVLVVH